MVTNLLLVGVIATLVWFGGRILEGLPKPDEHKGLPKPDEHKDFEDLGRHYFALFRIDALTELSFEVSFGDGWSTGRSFMLYGPPQEDMHEVLFPAELKIRDRIGVHIHPTPNWFERSRIGHIRVFEGGEWECHVALPYQIARQILEDVRRDPDQIVRIGFNKTSTKDGKTTYPIFMLQLSEAF